MNSKLRLSFLLLLVLATTPAGAAVSVGDSSLIDELHYSDTFTLESNGGVAGRIDGGYGFGSPAINVENNYGNPSRAWPNFMWSLNTDASAATWGNPTYLGGSGAGSATGITQSGLWTYSPDSIFGFEYGLSDHYVVQLDAVQPNDRVNITSGTAGDSLEGGLTVFFRGDGRPGNIFFNLSLYDGVNPETPIPFASGGIGVAVGEWANYAVRFDQANNTIEIYINEASLGGPLDLTTFAGGAYANWSNAAVGVGGYGGSILWTDNFQVGTAVVETGDGAPGDYNGDGSVDAADYVLWRKGIEPLPFNEVATIGITNDEDYDVWRANFGSEALGSGNDLGDGGAVPEPGSVGLVSAAVLVALGLFRRRAHLARS